MPTLSVLYVVRNESETISKSISSILAIADEIVIVDTGSTDDTLKICRQFRKTKIFSFPWENDFSKPRNFGVSKCSMNWVLYVDGDEVVDGHSAATIKKAVLGAKSNVHGLALRIVDHEESLSSVPNPSPFFPSPQVRAFRRIPSISFSGKVMESVRESIKSIGGGIDLLDAKIDHWIWRGRGQGYADLRVKYYNRLGAKLPVPTNVRTGTEPPTEWKNSSQSKVGIVIATMNALPATRQCLESLATNTSGAYETFVVDNGSIDGTPHVIWEMTGKRPTCFQKNEGVARARNIGAMEAMRDPTIEYVCFLDNDTRVPPGWIDDMVAVMEVSPCVGILGPISCCATGPQNAADQIDKRKYEDVYQLAKLRSPSFIPANKINGFCMLVRTEALKKIGLFDETLGLYGYEADDFCRRAFGLGYGIGIANQVYVQHQGRATLSANRADWQSVLGDSAVAYAKKWGDELSPEYSGLHSIKSSAGLASLESSILPHSRVSIVVLAEDKPAMLKDCLNSIMARTLNCEIIVVHSGAADATSDFLATRPAVKVVQGKGWSQGIKDCTSDYIVLASERLVVSNGWAGELFEQIDAGADMAGTDGWEMTDGRLVPSQAGMPSSHCCMIRRSVFEKVGLPDPECGVFGCVGVAARAIASGLSVRVINSTKTRKRAVPETGMERYGREDFSPEALPPIQKKFRVMYLGPTYDHGTKERGFSYESDNFHPALEAWGRCMSLCHFDQVNLSQKYGVAVMSEMLYDQARSFCPNIVLAVMQDENHDPRKDIMGKISANLKARTFGWFGDSGLRYANYDKKWAPHLDFCVTTSPEAFRLYQAQGLGGKAIRSLWAASPKCRAEAMRKEIDVTCLNAMHYDRRQQVEALRGLGITVNTPCADRRLSMEEQVGIINRSKIVVNLPSVVDGRARESRGKNMDVPACGSLLLTGIHEGLGEYFSIGSEVDTFDSTAELAAKITRYLGDDEARTTVASAGTLRAAGHTWEARLEQVVKDAGLL